MGRGNVRFSWEEIALERYDTDCGDNQDPGGEEERSSVGEKRFTHIFS
jgi:hypothetical protein